MIAALYVEADGIYANLPNVELWDERRDARNYRGPWPVVAHPPCARWSVLAGFTEHRYGLRRGDDGGCFKAALQAVRSYGGVLEHPAYSAAWKAFELPQPTRAGWTRSLFDPGWTTEVSQLAYGHRARKRTWLYYVGDEPPAALDWTDGEGECIVGDLHRTSPDRADRGDRPRMYRREALATPAAFRDALLELAQNCTRRMEARRAAAGFAEGRS